MTEFLCPIFNAKADTRACGKLLHLKMMGRQIDVRKGCQACMDSSKCPFEQMVVVNRHRAKQGVELTIDKGIPREVLERIRPVVVQEHHLNRRGASSVERQLISGANDRIDAMIGKAPSGESALPKRKSTKATPAKSAAPKTKNEAAAASGDLGAAISQAA